MVAALNILKPVISQFMATLLFATNNCKNNTPKNKVSVSGIRMNIKKVVKEF